MLDGNTEARTQRNTDTQEDEEEQREKRVQRHNWMVIAWELKEDREEEGEKVKNKAGEERQGLQFRDKMKTLNDT